MLYLQSKYSQLCISASYYNTKKPLPKRGSLQQDYLGYYNNNGYEGSYNVKPKLYFYANQGRHSILPFQRTNATGQYISGALDMTPNNYVLSGLLNKVTYPTGGTSEFIYETNEFKFKGATYVGGGARVKSQILKENGNIVKQLEYTYKEIDNSSSGGMNNIPIYGYINTYNDSDSSVSIESYNKPKGGLELTSGSYVGYSRVIEKNVSDNGWIEYKYSSPISDPNIPEVRKVTRVSGNHFNNNNCINNLIQNSAYPAVAYIDNDYKRGMLKEKKYLFR